MSNPVNVMTRTLQALSVAMEHVEWCIARGMTLGAIADSIGRPVYPASMYAVVTLVASEWVHVDAWNSDLRIAA